MKESKKNLQMPENLIADMNEHLPGDLTIKDIQRLFRGKKFKVWFIMNDALMNSPIDAVDLSMRASNTLKRAGFITVGDMINSLQSFDDLHRFRGCGATTISEIHGKMFFFQYSLIDQNQRTSYMKKIMEINGITG